MTIIYQMNEWMNEFAGLVRSTRSLSMWVGISPALPLTSPATGLRTGIPTHLNIEKLDSKCASLIPPHDFFLNRTHPHLSTIYALKSNRYRGSKLALSQSLRSTHVHLYSSWICVLTHLNPHLQVHEHPALRPQPGQAPAHGRRGGLGLYQRQLRTRLQLQAGVHRHSGM